MSRVKRMTSPRLLFSFLALSVLATVSVVPFWDTVSMSGTLFWSINRDEDKHNWVMISIFFVELLAGVIMAIVVLWLMVFRRPELHQVWGLHRRIKFYMTLTVIAILVDLSLGIGGVVYVLHEEYKPALIVATWTARHVHIALDTLVLYSALGTTSSARTAEWKGNRERVRPAVGDLECPEVPKRISTVGSSPPLTAV